jgi:XTP/dITP diphosphohydrolase
MNVRKLVMATKSEDKVREIRNMLPNGYELITMSEAGYHEEIIEDGNTVEENALIKARCLHKLTQGAVFGEDTGLFVEYLGGDPGINTARYAGDQRNNDDNINMLLKNLETKDRRNAYFKTVIAYKGVDGREYLFPGRVEGQIAIERKGMGGFGYDPVFIPSGYSESFAELGYEVKNQISHRSRAFKAFLEFLESKR